MGREETPRLLRREKTRIFWIASTQPRLPALIARVPEPRHGGQNRVKAKYMSQRNIYGVISETQHWHKGKGTRSDGKNNDQRREEE